MLMITHRTASAARADRILMLDQGRIVQEGSHEELLAQPGLYRRIYDMQREGGMQDGETHAGAGISQ